MRTQILAIISAISFLFTLSLNIMAATVGINGILTEVISDMYPVRFTPAGYVFSIWSLIYILLVGFGVYQLMPKRVRDGGLDRIRVGFILSNVLNAAWIVAWHQLLLGLSVMIMAGLLATLIWLYLEKIKLGDTYSFVWVQLPFSIYLGWISVATIANVAVFLYSQGINFLLFSDIAWVNILMGVAVLLALVMFKRYRDYAYGLVIVWALMGIGVKQAIVPLIQYPAWFFSVLLLVALVIGFFQSRKAEAKSD
jgi:translocator protein